MHQWLPGAYERTADGLIQTWAPSMSSDRDDRLLDSGCLCCHDLRDDCHGDFLGISRSNIQPSGPMYPTQIGELSICQPVGLCLLQVSGTNGTDVAHLAREGRCQCSSAHWEVVTHDHHAVHR